MAWHAGAGMGWWMLFGGLLWVIFCGTVTYVVVSLVRGRNGDSREGEDPIDVAKRRYASGQITREQYEQLRRDLAA